jgi:hypothetical protein
MKLEILIPTTLPRALSPNASRHLHWGNKRDARDLVKRLAETALIDMARSLPPLPLPTPIHYHVTVGLEKGQKTPDDDNAKANGALKKIRDTLATILTEGEDKDWFMDDLSMVRDPAGKGYILFTLEVPDVATDQTKA